MAKPTKSLADIISEANKKGKDFGQDLMSIGAVQEEIERIPFSIPELNRITYGGLPRGRMIEFFGKEGGGKTTTALDAVASFQKALPELRVMYVDVERTFDAEWAMKMGVDVDELLLFKPINESAGEILQIVYDAIETEELSLVVIDSLAFMVSDLEDEKEVGDRLYGGISLELTGFSKKASRACGRTKCTLLGINQLRDGDGKGVYGPGKKTPGGRAWKFGCSVRIEFTTDGHIKEDGSDAPYNCENPAGVRIKAAIIKTKVFPPDRKIGTYTLRFADGIDVMADTFWAAVNLGIVDKRGAWLYYMDEGTEVKWNGATKAQAALKEDSELWQRFSEVVNEQLIGC